MNIRFCNMCGKRMDFWDVNEDNTIHTRAGYGSKYDEEEIELHMCCECFDEIIDQCVISPLSSRKEEYIITKSQPDEECGFLE